jgi:hypothetical protein
MSEEELDRDLAKAGFDKARIAEKAQKEAARVRGARPWWRRTEVLGALALAAVVLLAIGLVWRGAPDDLIVGKPRDAAGDAAGEEEDVGADRHVAESVPSTPADAAAEAGRDLGR